MTLAMVKRKGGQENCKKKSLERGHESCIFFRKEGDREDSRSERSSRELPRG